MIPTEGLPTPEQIDSLARTVGVTFPADYRAFLGGCGSLLVSVREEYWPRPGIGSVGPHWQQTRFELSVFGVCSEVDWLRLEVEAAQFRAERDVDLVPVFAWANTSDRIGFDKHGVLHEWYRGDDPRPTGRTFAATLEKLLLEQRDYFDELAGF